MNARPWARCAACGGAVRFVRADGLNADRVLEHFRCDDRNLPSGRPPGARSPV
ncbi:hypothetical protein ACFQMM_06995 [Saliphagus sp. GCM10025308]